ncbi:MAG: Ribokinase [Spirochaetes bacterium ADurb.Bin315]|jgi:ribokinase|nr:ribokinase [Spirochaetota bacterium]OQA42223.1 MAG: Ribokinase [Spirochaetes bacterium ADurb.Bin315]HOE88815.1 ribokinase [Sphaerochaeta sp.]HOR79498.1 ribokinase [Sphaerochaeta sp.]HPB41596.1 ribokinase [Sphaerochaeta sp.]
MRKALCFGSLNIDYVYDVPHILRPGETLASTNRSIYPGGKGLNQSIALAKAGVATFHAGAVGEGGELLLETLQDSGVDTRFVRTIEGLSGHTVIQRDANGQNNIILYGGSNQAITEEQIDETLQYFSSGDYLLLQNEINLIPSIMTKAAEIGMVIVLNPSPIDEKLLAYPLELVDIFLLNEIEAMDIVGSESPPDELLRSLSSKFPEAQIVLTLGEEGALYLDRKGGKILKHGIFDVEVVDTTAAGDTFTGYFIATLAKTNDPQEALRVASLASALVVSRLGAAPSIPTKEEVYSIHIYLKE